VVGFIDLLDLVPSKVFISPSCHIRKTGYSNTIMYPEIAGEVEQNYGYQAWSFHIFLLPMQTEKGQVRSWLLPAI
jgi:hypothetical protein